MIRRTSAAPIPFRRYCSPTNTPASLYAYANNTATINSVIANNIRYNETLRDLKSTTQELAMLVSAPLASLATTVSGMRSRFE